MTQKNLTFAEKLYECDQHKKRILVAKDKLALKIPLSVSAYQHLDDNEISYTDQLIFRFTKLQDTMGEKLFPALLELTGEEIKKKTFIDRLNRLEELELVSKEEWMNMRKDRNQIAHEYSYNQQDIVDGINIIYHLSDRLIKTYDGLKQYSQEQKPIE